MIRSIESELSQLQNRVPIKNLHLVISISLFSNEEIFIVFQSSIQIHSMKKMSDSLPSLMYVIELDEIAKKSSEEDYQDEISKKLTQTQKSELGQVIFTEDLNPERNIFLELSNFEQRLRFLGSELIRVKKCCIHELGHLLITLEDSRCFFIRRVNSNFTHDNYENLYDLTNPIVLNHKIGSQIITSIFITHYPQLGVQFLCLNRTKHHKEADITKISLSPLSEAQTFNFSCRKLSISPQGLIDMFFVPQKQNDKGRILLCYFNRLHVLYMGKVNQKNKSLPLLSHDIIPFEEKLGREYLLSAKFFDNFVMGAQSTKIYLISSTSVWQLQLRIYEESTSVHYQLTKLQKLKEDFKTNIIHINHLGNYLAHDSYRSQGRQFVAESDHGIVIKLGMVSNYKEGQLSLHHYGSRYIYEKILQSISNVEHGHKPFLDFSDLSTLKSKSSLKKQILEEVNLYYKANKKKSQSESVLNVLIINTLTVFESKVSLASKLMVQELKNRLKLREDEEVALPYNRCYNSGLPITLQDVVTCCRCELYAIKHSNGSDLRCYICWNPLIDL